MKKDTFAYKKFFMTEYWILWDALKSVYLYLYFLSSIIFFLTIFLLIGIIFCFLFLEIMRALNLIDIILLQNIGISKTTD